SADVSPELVVAVHAPFDLGHEVFRQPQVSEGLLKDFSGVLRLAAVTLQALLGFEVATLSSFRVLFGVSFAWGHGVLLRTVMLFRMGTKQSMLSRVVIAKEG